MDWLYNRWVTLKEASGYRRYLIGGLAFTALALVDAISGYQVMTWLTGVPAWAIVLIVLLLSAWLWLLNYATESPSGKFGMKLKGLRGGGRGAE